MHARSNAATLFSSLFSKDRLITLWLCAIFLVLATARANTSLPWVDEGYFFDSAYNWTLHGSTGTPVVESKGLPWEGIERHQYWQPPLLLVWDTAWLKVFGLTLFALRALAIFAGLWLLASWIFLLDYFQAPSRVRNLALLFIATDYAVVRAGSDGRGDMISAACGMGAFALYLRFRDDNFTLAVILSQVLAVCGALTHPIGVLTGLGFVWYFFLKDKDWRKVKLMHISLAILPWAIGAAGWGMFIMQEPELFRKIFFGASASGRLGGFSHPLLAIQREIVVRYLTPFGLYGHSSIFKLKLMIPLIYAAGALSAWIIGPVRRQKFLHPFLAMWAIACFAVFAVDNQRNGTYLVDLLPHYAVLFAAVLCWLFEHWRFQRKLWGQTLAIAVVVGFVSLQVGGSLYIVLTDPYKHQYQPVVDYVVRHAGPYDRIVGTSELGFGIGFDRLHDDTALGYYVDKPPDLIVWNSRYQILFDAAQGTPVGDFMRSRMAKFKRVFGTGEFQVYTPRN